LLPPTVAPTNSNSVAVALGVPNALRMLTKPYVISLGFFNIFATATEVEFVGATVGGSNA